MEMRSVPGIYLRPGEYYFGRRPVHIHTVLGSCVAVSIYHRHSGLAAICHAVQPDFDAAQIGRQQDRQPARYVRWVVPAMIRAFLTRRVNPAEIEIKLFGGASLIGDPVRCGTICTVGALNISAAKRIIAENRLALKAADVGGNSGRKIIFNTQTGVVLMKRVQYVPQSTWIH